MKEDGIGWNIDKFRDNVVFEDVEVILLLKISLNVQLDLLGWYYTDDGIYIVKLGYWLSIYLLDNDIIELIWGDSLIK